MGQRELREPGSGGGAVEGVAPSPLLSSPLVLSRQDNNNNNSEGAERCSGYAPRNLSLCSRLQAWLDAKPTGTRSKAIHVALHAAMDHETDEAGQIEAQLTASRTQRALLEANEKYLQTKLEEATKKRKGPPERERVAKFIAQGYHTVSQQQKWARVIGIPWERFQALKEEVERGGK